jgi:AsmA protein
MIAPGRRRRWPKVAGALALLLVLAFAIAIFAIDAILLSQARKQADALSAQLGRPVTIGGVKTKLLGGLGLRVTDAGVGAGPGEDVPLVSVRRVEVELDLWRAIRSGGKELEVRSAVVEGLHANVVKLPDGTTNAQRAADAYARANPPAPEEEKEAEPSGPPPKVRVGRAAIENARIAFLDRTTPGAKELAIDDLDVEVKDLEAGKPLALLLRAAVLTEKQNLSVNVSSAPLPPSLEPTLERIAVKLEPVDLAPLAPFFPPDVGFRRGHLAIDLAAALGAAVPGGTGPTTLKGSIRGVQLAFSEARDRYVDVTFDADVEGDATAGSLRIGRLVLVVGPITVIGSGRATGLRTDAPRIEGLELVAKGLDPQALEPFYPPLREALGDAVVAGPIGLELRGGGTAEAQQATLRVDLTPVKLAVPEQLAKAAGAPASLVARVDLAGGGRARFDATVDLAGVDLRPGEALNKKPGDPLRVHAAGSYRPEGDGAAIEVSTLELVALADRLAGRASVRTAGKGVKGTTRFEADLRGERLDLDKLLVPAPEEKKGAPPPPRPEPLDPAAFRGLSGFAALRLGTLRMEGMDARNVVVRVKVEEDRITFDEARLEAFGGTVSAKGTTAKLAGPDQPFELALDLNDLAGAKALKLLSKREVVDGKLDATVKLSGKAAVPAAIATSLTGDLSGVLGDGVFKGGDLIASIAGPLAAKLPFSATKLQDRGATLLGKELPFSFSLANGVAALTKPLSFDAGGQGTISLEGGLAVDGTLRMPGRFALAPELIARLTGGRAKPKDPVPVAFQLGGPAWKPRVEALSLDEAAKAIATQAAAGALGRAVGVEGEDAKALAEKKRAEAEALAEQKAAEAQAKAREETEKRRRKVEDEAKKRLEGLLKR